MGSMIQIAQSSFLLIEAQSSLEIALKLALF
jgi:hypothetical protein